MMTNTYRATSPAAVAVYSDGAFERDFTPSEEQDVLNSGLLELVPRNYRVLSNNYAAGKQGDVVELGLLKEIEAALIQGGHIQRIDAPPASVSVTPDEVRKSEDLPPVEDAPQVKKTK